MSQAGTRSGEAHWNDPPAPDRARVLHRYGGHLLFCLPVALAAFRYHSILENYFFGDDFLNLYHIADDPLPKYLVMPNGGHVLLARNVLFYLSWQLFGTQPEYYFWTVLLTHLANVALLFGVVRLLTGSKLLASFGALMWGSSPLMEGTLGWYSVYGQVVVATVILVILYQALRAASRDELPSRGTRAGWYVLALVAASSFGTGTAIAFVLPVVLALLVSTPGRPWSGRLPLLSLVVVVPLFYAAQVWAYQYLSGSDLHAFKTYEKLLSDGSAIVPFGVGLTAFGLTRLVTGPVSPTTPTIWYGVLGAFGIVAIMAARFSDAGARRRLLACALLVVVTYGVIALGRGALAFLLRESTAAAVPFVTRYHYNGQLFLTLLLCATVACLPGRQPRAVIAVWYGVLLLAYLAWRPPLDHHDDARQATGVVVGTVREAVDKAPPGGTVRIQNRSFAPFPFAPTLFPGWAAVFTIFFPDNVVDGRRVYLIERNPVVIEALRAGRRTGTLLVPP